MAIKLKLDLRQCNHLRTGVRLAAELTPSRSNHRKFITIASYRCDTEGRRIALTKILNSISLEEVFFEVFCYEISNDYYVNNWDVSKEELLCVANTKDIQGIEKLETEIRKHLQDFSLLVPEWHCDNLY